MTSTYLSEEQLDSYAELAITAEHDGIKVDPAVVAALVDEVRRRKFQVGFLLRQIAKKDARSGEGDRAVREFLGAPTRGIADGERRTLTESEHNRAWHAIEGAAGEDGADPGTVLNAVLRALDLNPPPASA